MAVPSLEPSRLARRGDANNTHIGFEICEPPGFQYVNNRMTGYDAKAQEGYFRAAWQNAVDLCVYLCRLFQLTEKDIICHSEGYKLGIASNHGDVMHWFPAHGESMNSFRAAVKSGLQGAEAPKETAQKEAEVKTMRAFELLQDMNVRVQPNGDIIGSLQKGATVSGTQIISSAGTEWLAITYNGQSACVAVLPAAKGFAKEIISAPGGGNAALKAELSAVKSDLQKWQAQGKALEEKLAALEKNAAKLL